MPEMLSDVRASMDRIRRNSAHSWIGPSLALVMAVAGALLSVNLASGQSERPGQGIKGETRDGARQDVSKKKENSADSNGPKKNGPAKEVAYPLPQRVKMPAGILSGNKGWLNTSGDISMRDLKGKIVIFDFWTYCCINCMHVLPDLKYLEKKYPNELVVIGVHSAKFDNEKDSENIRRAIMRYEIEHPVVNDADMLIWRRIGVSGWPSILLVDAEGYACYLRSGEGQREILDRLVGQLVKYHRANGTLDETPIRFDLESGKLKPTPLRFPGKVLADERGNRLFVSDSNHNRIVISTLDGQLIDVVGTGTIGAHDGEFGKANFNRPQGMELVGETLYVADTENHLIRTIDLKQKTVSTLAGTGKQNRRRTSGGKLREAALNSPWALNHVDGTLYIAMAGPHQIWRHKLGSETIQVYAGSGLEDIVDGPLGDSRFAQPSGIVSDGEFLYVADSEGSSVRKVPLDPAKDVSTVVGTAHLPAGRLFAFGDIDGPPEKARLQHPIGIAIHGKTLYVADSYNHKVKMVSLGENYGLTTTFLGNGTRGDRLDPPQFAEPEGVSAAAGKLFIADTNNHRICIADLKSGKVSLLTIKGLGPPKPTKSTSPPPVSAKKAIQLKPQRLAAGDVLKIEIGLSFPEGYKLNRLAPLSYRLKADEGQNLFAAKSLKGRHKATAIKATAESQTAVVSIPLVAKAGRATIELTLRYAYCRDGTGGLCKVKTERWRIPLEVAPDGKKQPLRLTAPKAR